MRHKVRINFRSGHSVTVKCDNFKTKYVGNKLTAIEWENMSPKHLFISLEDIESIWEV